MSTMENMDKQPPVTMVRTTEEEDVIDLVEIFYLLLNHWRSIFLAMLAGAVLLGAYRVFLVRPSYQADAKIYITNTDSVVTFADLQLSSALTDDYAQIIKSRTALNRVIEELELDTTYDQLAKLIEVRNPDSTHIIEILVTCDDLELSRNIANALLNISIRQIHKIVGSSEPTVIDQSEAEAVIDVTPGMRKYVLIGALGGALLVCAYLIVRMLMDTTIKTEEDVEKYLHLPILAAVPYYSYKSK